MAVSTRQALLQALSSAGGSYVSGQQLAETLGVSRAAVHKAAAALTAQGYALEAAPRRGYRLAGGDPFCAEAIGDYPAPIYLYDTLESSNRTAKLLALDGAPHGTLVLTAHQSAGRGRLGRRFESPAGKGVYCSVLLRPEMPAANAQTATISAAVAVCRAVKKLCGLELAIKWVNDLYYQGRKVCGILTEAGTDLESGQLEWLVGFDADTVRIEDQRVSGDTGCFVIAFAESAVDHHQTAVCTYRVFPFGGAYRGVSIDDM